MKYYTGLSVNEVPLHFQAFIFLLSKSLSKTHFLRSGDANIGEFAFREGSESQGEILIPWPNFNESPSRFSVRSASQEKIGEMASLVGVNIQEMEEAEYLQYCNIAQELFGSDLDEKSAFLIVMNPKHLSHSNPYLDKAVEIAESHQIKVFNICKKEHFNRFKDMIEQNTSDSLYDQIKGLLWHWIKTETPRGVPAITVEDAKEAMSKIDFLNKVDVA